MGVGRELRCRARERRKLRLYRLVEEPDELLARPHESFALLVGNREGAGRGLTSSEFCKVSVYVSCVPTSFLTLFAVR